jgi:hypothetical protein
VIPETERFPGLREFLFRFLDDVVEANKHKPDLLAARPVDTFWALTLPWILELEVQNPNPDLRKMIDARKTAISIAGYDGGRVARDLKDIQETDKHLAECCPTLLHLARHLSFNFINEASTLREAGIELKDLDLQYAAFVKMTYEQGRFRRAAFTHVFNLDIEGRQLLIEKINVVRLNPDFKGELLREPGIGPYIHPFLHPPGVGDCFIYANEGASEKNDDRWLQEKRQEAAKFIMLLQYFKDGVVHIGYTVPQYYPEWAHQIRHEGLYFIGDPRREAHARGQALYKIEPAEHELLKRYWLAITTPAIAQIADDTSSKLRQAILRAGEYYEKSHETPELPERLVYLAIALEALFSPTNQEQLKFRIAHCAAQFLGDSAGTKKSTFDEVQGFYRRRNKLVHGDYPVEEYSNGTFVKLDEIERWSSLIRRAVVGFFVLALRGETKRERLITILEEAAFDQNAAENLRAKADIEAYLKEMGL